MRALDETDLRSLPGIDALLRAPELASTVARHGAPAVKDALRDLQAAWRRARRIPAWAASAGEYANAIASTLETQGYRRVFNLTGTMLHTNLGRAPLPATAFDAVRALVTQPMNLEFDLDTGRRGEREIPVERRLRRLAGAPAATVVNNCAAALLLVLNTLALRRDVPVSRGELIEIGGSFRLPEIMERAGCRLVEVGTTNRTHLADYAGAVDATTGLLLKVHPSNYRVEGFTHAPTVRELAELAHAHGLPLCVDLGSGALVDLERWGLPHEPTPRELLAQGADLVIFSGDKLLGSVQSGLIVGREDLVEACRRNPMKRALRADKVTLALLEHILGLYEDPPALLDELPLFRWLAVATEELERRAAAISARLHKRLDETFHVACAASPAEMGSGSLPGTTLPSLAVTIAHAEDRALRETLAALRRLPIPVIGRLGQGRIWLDLRGAEPLDELLTTLDRLDASHGAAHDGSGDAA
jgi:L-seryl-tRNA(Ser) seleniumtransferase